MREEKSPQTWLARVQDQFIWLLIASYLLAALWPSWGLALKELKLSRIGPLGTELTFFSVLLSWLLFNAGLGLSLEEIQAVAERPRLLFFGLAANVLIPVLYIGVVSVTVFPWLPSDKREILLAGLAVIAAVPIASSSTAWCQNANGNLALGLALVLFSTLFSPLTTPLTLELAGQWAPEFTASGLQALSTKHAFGFLLCFVLFPALAGLIVRRAVGASRVQSTGPALKVINLVSLLLLNYSNASISLPQVIARPDGGFLLLIVIVTGFMCGTAFGGGWLIARLLKADAGQRTALLFSLGMNNNGVGLVLASLASATDSRVLLPIILYNLWQHLIAGVIDRWLVGH